MGYGDGFRWVSQVRSFAFENRWQEVRAPSLLMQSLTVHVVAQYIK